jgi:hypothetical protein
VPIQVDWIQISFGDSEPGTLNFMSNERVAEWDLVEDTELTLPISLLIAMSNE